MITQQSLQSAQYRVISHYIQRLRQANEAIKRGHDYRTYWLNLIEQDWSQIKHWQQWTTLGNDYDIEKARYCSELCLAGNEILRIRQPPPERLIWLQQGLEAAQMIGDNEAERLCLFQLGQTYFYLGATEKAKECGYRLLELAQAAGDEVGMGHGWYTLGSAALHQGAMDDAEHAFQQCLAIFERLFDDIEVGRALQGIGRAAMFRGENQHAYEYFLRYLDIAERFGNEAELSTAYITMNNVLLGLRRYEEAKTYAERAVQICQQTGFQRMLPTAWLCLAVCEAELDDLEAAGTHMEQSIASARLIEGKSAVIDALRYLGNVKARQGNYSQAFSHFEEALELAREDHILYYLCEILSAQAWWYVVQGEIDRAHEALREAIGFAFELGSDYFLTIVLLPAIKLWQRMGWAEPAAEWVGVLTGYPEHVLPRMFDPLCVELERDLGAEGYHRALEGGKTVTLYGVLEAIMEQLGSSSFGGFI